MSFWKWWLALVGYSSPKHRWIWYCGAGCPWLRYLRSSARHRPLARVPPTPCRGWDLSPAPWGPRGVAGAPGQGPEDPACPWRGRALTLQELLRVQQLVGLLPLQLVGPVPVRGQRPVPVHPALALALHEDPLGGHPQQDPTFQVGQEPLQHLGHAGHPAAAAERPRRGELDLLHARGAVEALAVGGLGAGGDAAALGRAGGELLHQHVAVVEADVEPAVCGEEGVSVGLGGHRGLQPGQSSSYLSG